MKIEAWRAGLLLATVLFHVAFFAYLRMPEYSPHLPQTALIFNLVNEPKAYIPPPEPAKNTPISKENPNILGNITGSVSITADNSTPSSITDDAAPPPPLPYVPQTGDSDTADDDRPALSPDANGTPEGEQGGVPEGESGGTSGGAVGGMGTGTGDTTGDGTGSAGNGNGNGTGTGSAPSSHPEVVPEPKVDVKAIQNEYVAGVKSKIYGCKFYPEQAKRMEHEGSVKVRFTVSVGGGVSGVSVASSSGFDDLDSAAVQAVKNAAPFAAIPETLGKSSLTINVTLKYYLK